MRKSTLVAPLVLSLTIFACDDPDSGDDGADEATEGDEAEEAEAGDGDGDGEEAEEAGDGDGDPGPLDSDQDGLSDEEEAEYGTDPLKKDTDADNYWDLWELNEGTDPLDVNSRIYTGYWPYNPNKDLLEQGSWATASTNTGAAFPRAEFLDHHGDMVDLYDFTNFEYGGEEAYFIFDLSAQWCGPCHNVASWISGIDDANTGWIQTAYPTVREKVHSYRIWWITFVVENSAGGAPTAADASTWFSVHHDNYIPIMSDVNQQMWPAFGSSAFPHFFLLDPEMKIEYFPQAGGTDTDPYPAVGLVDTLL